jgi:hypothetical protein
MGRRKQTVEGQGRKEAKDERWRKKSRDGKAGKQQKMGGRRLKCRGDEGGQGREKD